MHCTSTHKAATIYLRDWGQGPPPPPFFWVYWLSSQISWKTLGLAKRCYVDSYHPFVFSPEEDASTTGACAVRFPSPFIPPLRFPRKSMLSQHISSQRACKILNQILKNSSVQFYRGCTFSFLSTKRLAVEASTFALSSRNVVFELLYSIASKSDELDKQCKHCLC